MAYRDEAVKAFAEIAKGREDSAELLLALEEGHYDDDGAVSATEHANALDALRSELARDHAKAIEERFFSASQPIAPATGDASTTILDEADGTDTAEEVDEITSFDELFVGKD